MDKVIWVPSLRHAHSSTPCICKKFANLRHAGLAGTPLPLPVKSDRKGTWSAQTASTLVNLARRTPLGAKTLATPPSATTSVRTRDSSIGAGDVESPGFDRSSASLSKNDSPPATPSSVPKRRQRSSLSDPIGNSSREEVFVVAAPVPEQVPPSTLMPDDEPSYEQTQLSQE